MSQPPLPPTPPVPPPGPLFQPGQPAVTPAQPEQSQPKRRSIVPPHPNLDSNTGRRLLLHSSTRSKPPVSNRLP